MSAALPPLTPRPHPPTPAATPRTGLCNFLEKKKKTQNKQKVKVYAKVKGRPPPAHPGASCPEPSEMEGALVLPCGEGTPTRVGGGQTRPTRSRRGLVTWARAPGRCGWHRRGVHPA